jgi:hypothetical protein
MFAGPFLCGVERRRGVVLGTERLWPSDDRFGISLEGGGFVLRGVEGGTLHCAADLFFFFAQLGDGSTSQRQTPVAVVGLSSGVAMVALGAVRLIAIAAWLLLVCERCRCVLDSLERCDETRGVVT